MKIVAVPISVLALAVCAGCAQTPSGSTSTSAIGAFPAQRVVMCRDAAWVSSPGECGTHGGVERVMAAPAR